MTDKPEPDPWHDELRRNQPRSRGNKTDNGRTTDRKDNRRGDQYDRDKE